MLHEKRVIEIKKPKSKYKKKPARKLDFTVSEKLLDLCEEIVRANTTEEINKFSTRLYPQYRNYALILLNRFRSKTPKSLRGTAIKLGVNVGTFKTFIILVKKKDILQFKYVVKDATLKAKYFGESENSIVEQEDEYDLIKDIIESDTEEGGYDEFDEEL